PTTELTYCAACESKLGIVRLFRHGREKSSRGSLQPVPTKSRRQTSQISTIMEISDSSRTAAHPVAVGRNRGLWRRKWWRRAERVQRPLLCQGLASQD